MHLPFNDGSPCSDPGQTPTLQAALIVRALPGANPGPEVLRLRRAPASARGRPRWGLHRKVPGEGRERMHPGRVRGADLGQAFKII